MESSKLKVYNRARILAEQINLSTQKVPRATKYRYIDPIVVMVYGIMEYISFANDNAEQRVAFIDAALSNLAMLKVRVRIVYDMKYMKRKGYDAVIREEENVTRQLIGWRKQTLGEK